MAVEDSKKVWGWAGSVLSIVALVFLATKLTSLSTEIYVPQLVPIILPLIVLSIIYAAANLTLALAWKNLLRHFDISVSSRWAAGAFGVSQIAKYVPGNIFQFVGRQALGIQSGLASGPLAKSSLWEIALLVITGSMAILLVLPYAIAESLAIPSIYLLGVIALCTLWLANRLFSRWIVRAMLWQMIFQCIAGSLFLALFLFIYPIPYSEFTLVIGAYILAWLAGLITPGSPAGIGIREIVLLFLLRPILSETDLLMAISLSRLVTVSGDLLFYVVCMKIWSQTETIN